MTSVLEDKYVWNTQDTTDHIIVREPGKYILQVISPYGCSNSERISVSENCYLDVPNAFSPNGDGQNDYFFPRKLLSRRLLLFSIQVVNRWGQVMFESENLDGRGWDGNFNGTPQPEGTYVFVIKFSASDDNSPDCYKGTVTLLR